MCQTCVEDGTISAWLLEVIEAHERVYDDGYGFAHIVIGDNNVRDSDIHFCLNLPRQGLSSDPATEDFLRWLLTVPEKERCPNLVNEDLRDE